MSEITPLDPNPEQWEQDAGWSVREATREDAPAIATGLLELLFELGGKPPPRAALEKTARELIDDPSAGVVLVAESEGEIVGVLGVSWQIAIRIPGRYGLIQELWVAPRWRTRRIGAELVQALLEIAHAQGVSRLEVGLPGERFPHLEATEAFYANNGFTAIGMRMRRLL